MRDPEKFWEKVSEKFFIDEVSEIDYSDFLDLGEECGLLTPVPFDPELHQDVVGAEELGKGEIIYVPVPRTRIE
jgi:hypothetical protein